MLPFWLQNPKQPKSFIQRHSAYLQDGRRLNRMDRNAAPEQSGPATDREIAPLASSSNAPRQLVTTASGYSPPLAKVKAPGAKLPSAPIIDVRLRDRLHCGHHFDSTVPLSLLQHGWGLPPWQLLLLEARD
jgi:hypothetical protein